MHAIAMHHTARLYNASAGPCNVLARYAVVLTLALGMTPFARATDYPITQYGAVPDTSRLCTAAIQQAIDACAAAGGGRVVVPTGQWKTGSLRLRSHVNLYLESGATLYGSTDLADYRREQSAYVSLRTQTSTVQLIYTEGETDVALSGQGTIDGQGHVFPKLDWNDEGITRPHLLRFISCQKVTVTGITLRQSGCWMQHYLACDDVHISGIRVFNRNNYNNDALDLDGCHNVVVSDLICDSDDDGITLKSTSPRLCENIAITGCVVSSRCNAIKLGTETNGGFRNISVSNCIIKPSSIKEPTFFGHAHGHGGIALEIVDGGTLENVVVSNIVIQGTESPIFIRLGNRARPYREGQVIDHVGTLRGVTLANIRILAAGPVGCSITGLPGHYVEDVCLSHISIEQAGGCTEPIASPQDEKAAEYPEATMWGNLPATGFFIRHARNIRIDDLHVQTLQPDARPTVVLDDVEQCTQR